MFFSKLLRKVFDIRRARLMLGIFTLSNPFPTVFFSLYKPLTFLVILIAPFIFILDLHFLSLSFFSPSRYFNTKLLLIFNLSDIFSLFEPSLLSSSSYSSLWFDSAFIFPRLPLFLSQCSSL